jgi:lysozyme family protein
MTIEIKPSDSTILKVMSVMRLLEGKVSNDSRDIGRLTKYGFASKYYPQVLDTRFDIIDAMELTKGLLLDTKFAQILYFTNNFDLAMQHFQFAFNVNNVRAMRLFQTYLKLLGSEIRIDGLYGPKTEAALEQHANELDVAVLRTLQVGWYEAHGLATGQKYFIGPWRNRVTSNLQYALDNIEVAQTEFLRLVEVAQNVRAGEGRSDDSDIA